jgi:iron(III) transport system substrate-binding protein
VPTGWESLYHPKFSGGLVGLPESGSAVVTLQCYSKIAQTHGMELVEKIGKLKPRMYPGIGPTVQAVAAGANAVGLVSSVSPADLIKAGAPIKQIVPTNPSCYYGYFAGQVKWSKRPEAAQVLMNWLLSREGQEAVHGWGHSASPLEGIPGALRIKPGEQLMDGVLTPAQEEFGRRFNKAIAG